MQLAHETIDLPHAETAAALTRVFAAGLRERGGLTAVELEWLAGLERGIAERRPDDAVEALHRQAMGLLGETRIVEFMVAAEHVAAVLAGPEREARIALSLLDAHVHQQLGRLALRPDVH